MQKKVTMVIKCCHMDNISVGENLRFLKTIMNLMILIKAKEKFLVALITATKQNPNK